MQRWYTEGCKTLLFYLKNQVFYPWQDSGGRGVAPFPQCTYCYSIVQFAVCSTVQHSMLCTVLLYVFDTIQAYHQQRLQWCQRLKLVIVVPWPWNFLVYKTYRKTLVTNSTGKNSPCLKFWLNDFQYWRYVSVFPHNVSSYAQLSFSFTNCLRF